MNTMTATDAKNKFGQLIEMSRTAPVRIQKQGRDVAILLSPEEFERLAAASRPGDNPLIERLYAESKQRWSKIYEALAK